MRLGYDKLFSGNGLRIMIPDKLSLALKDWAVAVEALLRGETCVLLRKGGIRDGRPGFQVKSREALLLPNREHQRPELVKEAFRPRIELPPPGWKPVEVQVLGWVQIVEDFEITSLESVTALGRHHIWTDTFAAERFGWRPTHPLHVLLIRAYRLAVPQAIRWREAYGGCRSWADLDQPISTNDSHPVLDDAAFAATQQAILKDLGITRKEPATTHAAS